VKTENPAALGFILQEDIYLLETDRVKPEILIADVPKTPDAQLNYSGLYKKKFLVIVHYNDHEFIDADHFTALQNILKRKDYHIDDDVAIFNLAKNNVDIKQVLTSFNPQKLLLLGEKSIPAGMNTPGLNQCKKIDDCTLLYSFSFDEMMDNTDYKKAFWEQMKNL